MSRQYSIPTMLRMVPNCLLKEFFERLGHEDDEFPWTKLGEREVSPMIKWIGLLPREAQNTIDAELRRIFGLACHTGIEALFEAAANCGELNMASDMPSHVGLYAKAMWVWLHRREVFERATLIHQVEHISWWRKRWDMPRCEADKSEVVLARLQQEISELLLLSQGRGQICTVETMSRLDGTEYFFAYPDDFVHNFSVHDEEGKLDSQAVCPTFSIVFAYRQDEGSLEMFGKVPAELKRRLEEIFAEVVLGVRLGPWDPGDVYQLDHLKYRSTRLETDPEDRLTVKIKRMWLFVRSTGRRLCVVINGNDPEDNIHKALDECLNRENVPLSDVLVTSVRLHFEFLPLEGRVPGSVQFDVGRPNSCTLRNELPERVALCEKYLRIWDIERRRPVGRALAATG